MYCLIRHTPPPFRCLNSAKKRFLPSGKTEVQSPKTKDQRPPPPDENLGKDHRHYDLR